MQTILKHYLEEAERIWSHTSAIWAKQRKIALERLLQKGFPSVKDENWRYIARLPILRQTFRIGRVAVPTTAEIASLPLPEPAQPDTLRFFCLNGIFHLPSAISFPPGLQIKHINHMMQRHPEILVASSSPEAIHLGHGFHALNTAFSQEGIMIAVEDGCIIEPTIELWHISHRLPSTMTEPMMFCVRHDIRIGKNSAAKIVEYTMMLEEGTRLVSEPSLCTNTLTTLTLQSGAEASWAQSIRVADQHSHVGQLAVQQHENSTFHAESLALGGGLVRHTLSVNLCEASAACELRGLSMVKRQHQVDHQVAVYHHADHTKSDIHYRAIADDQGRASFGGEVTAQSGIRHMSSHQGNYNLLLSDYAEIDTRPRLALFSGDIQCTHGATVGALDADILFYLRARGLSEKKARLMLIQAFTQVILQEMPVLFDSQKMLSVELEAFMEEDRNSVH